MRASTASGSSSRYCGSQSASTSSAPHLQHRFRRGHEGVGRHNHLGARPDSGGPQGEFDRVRAVRDGDAVLDTDEGRELLLERMDLGTQDVHAQFGRTGRTRPRCRRPRSPCSGADRPTGWWCEVSCRGASGRVQSNVSVREVTHTSTDRPGQRPPDRVNTPTRAPLSGRARDPLGMALHRACGRGFVPVAQVAGQLRHADVVHGVASSEGAERRTGRRRRERVRTAPPRGRHSPGRRRRRRRSRRGAGRRPCLAVTVRTNPRSPITIVGFANAIRASRGRPHAHDDVGGLVGSPRVDQRAGEQTTWRPAAAFTVSARSAIASRVSPSPTMVRSTGQVRARRPTTSTVRRIPSAFSARSSRDTTTTWQPSGARP